MAATSTSSRVKPWIATIAIVVLRALRVVILVSGCGTMAWIFMFGGLDNVNATGQIILLTVEAMSLFPAIAWTIIRQFKGRAEVKAFCIESVSSNNYNNVARKGIVGSLSHRATKLYVGNCHSVTLISTHNCHQSA